MVALGVTPFRAGADGGRPEWTIVGRKLMDKAPNRVEVLKTFMDKFVPISWVGSRTAIIESNMKLLDELSRYNDPALDAFIAEEKARLADAIKAAQTLDQFMNREPEERFE
jgi:hypothetical protein